MNVQFLTHDVPASNGTIHRRADVAQRLDELGHIDAEAGEVNTTDKQWIARIGDTELPVLDWSVQKLDDGTVAVSLVAVVDAVSAGDPGPADDARPGVTEEQARANERHQMVVDRLEFAERQQHDHTLARWTCGCDPVLVGIQDAAAKTGNIDLRVVQA